MAHVPPLPGTPLYDAAKGVQGLIDHVKRDTEELLKAGAEITAFDPEAMPNIKAILGDRISFSTDEYQALHWRAGLHLSIQPLYLHWQVVLHFHPLIPRL